MARSASDIEDAARRSIRLELGDERAITLVGNRIERQHVRAVVVMRVVVLYDVGVCKSQMEDQSARATAAQNNIALDSEGELLHGERIARRAAHQRIAARHLRTNVKVYAIRNCPRAICRDPFCIQAHSTSVTSAFASHSYRLRSFPICANSWPAVCACRSSPSSPI